MVAAWRRSFPGTGQGQWAPVPGSRKNGEKTAKYPEPRSSWARLPVPCVQRRYRGEAQTREIFPSPQSPGAPGLRPLFPAWSDRYRGVAATSTSGCIGSLPEAPRPRSTLPGHAERAWGPGAQPSSALHFLSMEDSQGQAEAGAGLGLPSLFPAWTDRSRGFVPLPPSRMYGRRPRSVDTPKWAGDPRKGLRRPRRGSGLVDLRFAAGKTALFPARKVAEGRAGARWKALGEADTVVPGPKRWLDQRASSGRKTGRRSAKF